MHADPPVVIVGAGLAGAGAAWALARRSVPVVVLEQFAAGHPFGGSHGSARIVRRAYGDALYVGQTGRAFELWREAEEHSGARLLRLAGGLDFGPGRDVRAVAGLLAAAGVGHEVLAAAGAADRWPGMAFEGEVLFHDQAGVLDADAAVAALLELARGRGAEVWHEVAVTRVRAGAVELADGTLLPARCVVVAAGAWAPGLLAAVPGLPALQVTRQSVFHFPRRDPAAAAWPSVIHEQHGGAVYHLTGGRDGGPGEDRKIGLHDPGPEVAPSSLGTSGSIDPATRDRVTEYVRRWLPGLEPQPRGETTCLYTCTPTEDFLLDRVDDVVVCSPCSGHGAKFAPLVGEWVADLVTGAGTVPERFQLAGHRTGRGAAVSL